MMDSGKNYILVQEGDLNLHLKCNKAGKTLHLSTTSWCNFIARVCSQPECAWALENVLVHIIYTNLYECITTEVSSKALYFTGLVMDMVSCVSQLSALHAKNALMWAHLLLLLQQIIYTQHCL